MVRKRSPLAWPSIYLVFTTYNCIFLRLSYLYNCLPLYCKTAKFTIDLLPIPRERFVDLDIPQEIQGGGADRQTYTHTDIATQLAKRSPWRLIGSYQHNM